MPKKKIENTPEKKVAAEKIIDRVVEKIDDDHIKVIENGVEEIRAV